jgi:3'(2'), 5'-bisphosphate nucleotidase
VVAASQDHALAARLARGAGELLLRIRSRLDEGDDPDAVRGSGDSQAHAFLCEMLAAASPGDAVLSEEGRLDPTRLAAERLWIVDPLDGTREFGEAGREDWAVHVALVIARTPVAAAVALPARGLTLATDPAPEPPDREGGAPRLVISRTRPTAFVEALADALEAEVVPMGSAGAKAMAVVLGEADVYAHSGGQYEWDSAAPAAVAAAAGLHVSRLDGSPLRYNQPNPYLPDLLICRLELAEACLAIAADHEKPRKTGLSCGARTRT